MKISKTSEFDVWFKKESFKSQAQIASRFLRIQLYDHLGDYKVFDGLGELRWRCGRRIYFTIYEEKGKTMLLLIGGYKNAQNKDIKKAKTLIKKYKKET